ncbi:MAG: helix-turn-helix transcriptional regulator [Clostridiales bacterium]|nr:helix-turn-helix transcriptional regulator [Clostridiales bacterium]
MTFRDARVKHGYTQKEMAEMLGIGQPAVCKIETGRQLPALKTALQIAKILNLQLDDLWDMFCTVQEEE